MKKKFLEKSMKIVKKKYVNLSCEEEEKIAYGLEALYLTMSKMVIVLSIACILRIVKETLLLMIFYNVIRTTAFGMHAKKSSHCLIISLVFFIGGALLCKYIYISFYVKFVISVFSIICLAIYAPADTYKRPLINAKRRRIYKILSVISGSIFLILIIIFRDLKITSYICVGLLEGVMMIHPLTYRMFQLPYSNYKTYLATNN